MQISHQKAADGDNRKVAQDDKTQREQWDKELQKRRGDFEKRIAKDFPQHTKKNAAARRATPTESSSSSSSSAMIKPSEESIAARAAVRETITLAVSSMPRAVQSLSIALTLPLLVSPAFYTMQSLDPETLITLQLNYSALLLLMFGSMHIGLAMAGYGKWGDGQTSSDMIVQKKSTTAQKAVVDNTATELRNAAQTNRQWTQAVDALPTGVSSPHGWTRMLYGFVSAAVALMSLSFPALQAVVLLSVSHALLLLYDILATRQGLAPWWFAAFKTPIVIITIVITIMSLLFYLVYGTMYRLKRERLEMQKEAEMLLQTKDPQKVKMGDQSQESEGHPSLKHMIRRRPGMTVTSEIVSVESQSDSEESQ